MIYFLVVIFLLFVWIILSLVVRLEKLKPKLPKLNIIPANDAQDESYQRTTRPISSPTPTPSPSPSPQPPEYLDPEFDPDNVVIRGSVTDDDDDDE